MARIYRPAADRTNLTDETWEKWTGYVLPRAVAAGQDSQDVKRVRVMLSFAAGLLDWCYSEGFADPAQPDQVWRTTTINRYAKHLGTQGSPDTTVSQTKWALNLISSVTPTPLADEVADQQANGPQSDENENVDATPIALLTEQHSQLDVSHARTQFDVRYWALLAAIRERVLANHPNATAKIPRARNASIPLGDREVARILFATETLTKQRSKNTAAWAYLCLGLGAGLRIYEMLAVTGQHIRTDPDGAVTVTVPPSPTRAQRDVPVLAPFAAILTSLAGQTEHRSMIQGRGNGKTSANRGHNLANAIGNRDPEAVRADSGRLRATWLCVHLACGTPLTQLLDIAGLAHPESLEDLMPYVPATCHDGHRPWNNMAATTYLAGAV